MQAFRFVGPSWYGDAKLKKWKDLRKRFAKRFAKRQVQLDLLQLTAAAARRVEVIENLKRTLLKECI